MKLVKPSINNSGANAPRPHFTHVSEFSHHLCNIAELLCLNTEQNMYCK